MFTNSTILLCAQEAVLRSLYPSVISPQQFIKSNLFDESLESLLQQGMKDQPLSQRVQQSILNPNITPEDQVFILARPLGTGPRVPQHTSIIIAPGIGQQPKAIFSYGSTAEGHLRLVPGTVNYQRDLEGWQQFALSLSEGHFNHSFVVKATALQPESVIQSANLIDKALDHRHALGKTVFYELGSCNCNATASKMLDLATVLEGKARHIQPPLQTNFHPQGSRYQFTSLAGWGNQYRAITPMEQLINELQVPAFLLSDEIANLSLTHPELSLLGKYIASLMEEGKVSGHQVKEIQAQMQSLTPAAREKFKERARQQLQDLITNGPEEIRFLAAALAPIIKAPGGLTFLAQKAANFLGRHQKSSVRIVTDGSDRLRMINLSKKPSHFGITQYNVDGLMFEEVNMGDSMISFRLKHLKKRRDLMALSSSKSKNFQKKIRRLDRQISGMEDALSRRKLMNPYANVRQTTISEIMQDPSPHLDTLIRTLDVGTPTVPEYMRVQ